MIKKNPGDEFMKAVEGMTFLGDPVEKMSAEQLLVVVGHLHIENEYLKNQLSKCKKDFMDHLLDRVKRRSMPLVQEDKT